jgi:hypothetical protein
MKAFLALLHYMQLLYITRRSKANNDLPAGLLPSHKDVISLALASTEKNQIAPDMI